MPSRSLLNHGFDFLVRTAPLLLLGMMLSLLLPLLTQGLPEWSWEYFLSDPTRSGRAGGIRSILVANSLILFVCMSVALPLGLGTAIFLSECCARHQTLARLIRGSLAVLAGVPSIVFGLFGNAFFCKTLGLGFSILSGGLTLACMVLPLMIRSAELGFRAVPRDYRLAAASLGLRPWPTLFHLVIPVAIPSVITGFILALGRALAETAALIFTSGYVDRMPGSLFDSGRSLSLHIYDLAMNVAGGDRKAYAASVSLLLLLLLVNTSASFISERWMQKRIQN